MPIYRYGLDDPILLDEPTAGIDGEDFAPKTFTFTPPSDGYGCQRTDIDPVLRMRNPNGNNLGRHYTTPDRAINVWILLDGTVTDQQPATQSLVKRLYAGSSTYTISSAERDALVAAGYTVVTSP